MEVLYLICCWHNCKTNL